MNILESIASAVHSVLSNRMRSILTMLGIIIGIAAVIMITSIGSGFQNSVGDMFSGFGAGALQIQMRWNTPEPITQSDLLTMESAEFLAEHPDIISVSPISISNTHVRLRNPSESANLQIFATNETFRDIQDLDIRFGRFLMEMDVDRATPVIIIDSTLARDIFGRTDVVGETIDIAFGFGRVDMTVVGVFRNDDPMAGMFGMPTTAYVPITFLQRMTNADTRVDIIMANASDLDRLDEIAEEITRLLSLKHGNEDMYSVTSLMSQIDMINDILGMITSFVALVAFISLAVGGIGVMNIMLVTVTERTREIGIRKSLGATDANIMFQFLVEAMILTATGGILGIIIGYYGGFALGTAIDVQPAMNVATVALTVTASSLIGIIFGVYPARKAAKLDPIEALRFE